MTQSSSYVIADAAAMETLGAALAKVIQGGLIIHLNGELGAGKTTLVRGLLRGLGHAGSVRSPTYTLVEPYELAGRQIYHLDLYRLGDPEELEWIGLRDLLDADSLALIEWPERGRGMLPQADLELTLEYFGTGRRVTLTGHSEAGAAVIAQLDAGSNSAGDLGNDSIHPE
ncbi:MAG TPA: tRNA (adenosine(37)-N6)-threonylcarbamoyltransferase complex ATPase subunit type 1 TsaE [Gammaproteobacteria bacterium]